jgi:RNA polymerase sigma-70 factor (ECF subfamily)
MAKDELELIRRLQSGDVAAFRELVEANKQRLFALAYGLVGNAQEAEDVSQEAFIKVYRGIGGFRGDAQLSSWMYRIVVNLCLNRRRKKSLSAMELREDFENDGTLASAAGDNPEHHTEASLLQRHLRHALQRLSPQQRTIFILRHDQDLPLKEISSIMKISEGTVKSQLFRAVAKLQQALAFYKVE